MGIRAIGLYAALARVQPALFVPEKALTIFGADRRTRRDVTCATTRYIYESTVHDLAASGAIVKHGSANRHYPRDA
jgi:hypothetical protein